MKAKGLLQKIRKTADTKVWTAAVQLSRSGAVHSMTKKTDKLKLSVSTAHSPTVNKVFLWLKEGDWECDCTHIGAPCIHVCAALIALEKDGGKGLSSKQSFIPVRYAFTSLGSDLELTRSITGPDGKQSPLTTSLRQSNLQVSRSDLQAESLLTIHTSGALPANTTRRLLQFLDGQGNATLDNKKIRLGKEPCLFELRVTDDGDDFRIALYRPPGIQKLYRGAAVMSGVLRPTSHGTLTPEQRKMLLKGVSFTTDEVGRLVREMLPKLRERIPIRILTKRLPNADALIPQVRVRLEECGRGLKVHGQVTYGIPALAEITPGGSLKALQEDVVPTRDLGAERTLVRKVEALLELTVGFPQILPPERAVHFLTEILPNYNGPIEGKIDPSRFHVSDNTLAPKIEASEASESGRWTLNVSFENENGSEEAEAQAVLHAWRSGQSIVPLLDGGYSQLPADWLEKHGTLLRELLEARDTTLQVSQNATAALMELLEDTGSAVPPDLTKLRDFLDGKDALPEVSPPTTLKGELRSYQKIGFAWLQFLRNMQINGILADDMGLGKTVQALAILLDSPGPSLIVAPTSVLSNWKNEAAKFAPSLSVNLYHGTDRKLDDSDLTLTSYAILRLDNVKLCDRRWTYAILDEAHAIKNVRSKTTQSAYRLRADHCLALTGTPLENRLEELWSLFQFLLPGLLGSWETFREHFVKPISNGSPHAQRALQKRIGPYVLRRLKKQVAADLPSLTEMVIRCEMPPEQRDVYEAVSLTAYQDVQAIFSQQEENRNTLKILEALLRMRQACCDPSLLPGFEHRSLPSCKLDRLEQLLSPIVSGDHKALVFSQWTSFLDRVGGRLDAANIEYTRLDGSTRNRQKVIDHFQSPEGPKIFLISLKAGGVGLNLTAADYVFILDPWWNPATEQQATDRAHRIGQTKPVVCCRLITSNTVEEKVMALQDSKRSLFDAALGGPQPFIGSLSATELRTLFHESQ